MLDIYIPFWGEPALLYQAVDSVLAQTSDRWRLTIIDDAYPDMSVADHFAAIADGRLRYRRLTNNEGVTANFQRCVDDATADYVCIMGCDDVMLPHYVQVICDAIGRNRQADIIQPGVQAIDSTGAVVLPLADRAKRIRALPRRGREAMIAGRGLAESMLYGDWLYWPSLTFRTSAIRGFRFREDLPFTQDLALIVDMAFAGASLLYTPEVCFSYRRHAASVSARDLVDGPRLADERRYFRSAARQARQHRAWRAALAAVLHPKSRVLAATLLPQAMRARNLVATRRLLRHIFWA